MIYITGDIHNTTDMSNLFFFNMKLCCLEQNVDYKTINYAIVLGGALSDDKKYRISHKSWWCQEELSAAEKNGILSKIQSQETIFDYVLSHTGTSNAIACIDSYFLNEDNLKDLKKDSTVVFNDKIDSLILYKKWFLGIGTAIGDMNITTNQNTFRCTIKEL